jgi:CRISPR-associated protein Cst2
MRSTQNPHIVDFKGVISVSHDVVPAPCISPLKLEFGADVKQIAEAINSLRPNAVEVKPFASLGEFAQLMAELTKSAKPLTIAIARS